MYINVIIYIIISCYLERAYMSLLRGYVQVSLQIV